MLMSISATFRFVVKVKFLEQSFDAPGPKQIQIATLHSSMADFKLEYLVSKVWSHNVCLFGSTERFCSLLIKLAHETK